jgi:ethanolamine utilization protein EutN
MQIARVVGLVVSTVKQSGLQGRSLLLLERVDLDDVQGAGGAPDVRSTTAFVATDHVGAGVGEVVLVTTGSAARRADPSADVPTDAAVVAIVDTVVVDHETVFSKNG